MRSNERSVVPAPVPTARRRRGTRPAGFRAAAAAGRLLVAALAALALPRAVAAMEFGTAPGPGGRLLVYATGPIVTGDAGRLRFVLYEAADKRPHLVINSGGGLAAEGMRIARMVAAERIPVTAGEVCASACFLVLAASPDRSAGPSSRVGVHRAYSRSTGESSRSLDATMDLARYAASLGVPAPILARMVTTPGGETSIAWLTADELRSMDVKPTAQAAAPAAQQAAAAAAADDDDADDADDAAAPLPEAPARGAGAGSNGAEAAGRADRARYKRWLAGLSDSGREGAAFWAKQRLLPRPGSCLRGGDSAFSLACFEAQRWWARADEQGRDPGYRQGWEGR